MPAHYCLDMPLNARQTDVAQAPTLPSQVPVEAAMRYVEAHYGDTWQVKSWSGNTASDGVVEGSRGYALMRRSVLQAAAAAQAEAAAAQAGHAGDD